MRLRQSRSFSSNEIVYEVTGVGNFYDLQNSGVCPSCRLKSYCTGPNLRGNPMITFSVGMDRASRQIIDLEMSAGCKDI